MPEFFNNLLGMNDRLGNLPANELPHESISPISPPSGPATGPPTAFTTIAIS